MREIGRNRERTFRAAGEGTGLASDVDAYDAHYLALAESRQCECWTADERLWNTVKKDLPWVHWVGQHASTTSA